MNKPAALPAQLAKAALQRIAQARLEPTPENYARAYAIEAGTDPAPVGGNGAPPERLVALLGRLVNLGVPPGSARQDLQNLIRDQRWEDAVRQVERLHESAGPGAQAEALAQMLERLVRGLERGGRQWTLGRKKDGVARVLELTRNDSSKIVKRMGQLIASWDKDAEGSEVESAESGDNPSQFLADFGSDTGAGTDFATLSRVGTREAPRGDAMRDFLGTSPAPNPAWPDVSQELGDTVRHALRKPSSQAGEASDADGLMRALEAAQGELRREGASPERAAQMAALCQRARHLLDHRRHLFNELGGLCRELSRSLVDLAEDDSWAKGQSAAIDHTLSHGLSGRGVRVVTELLAATRERQRGLREERARAHESLKALIQRMLTELGALGQHTDRFSTHVGRYADAIERADSLESLAGTVREMVEESRSVQSLVSQTQSRLTLEHDKAMALSQRVEQLEGELRRLAEEVHTDQLTQIANRRGLIQAFGIEQAKAEREQQLIALALLDIDNFKKLNDSLGHHAGDIALKSLAERAQASLRPGDMVARYGGEEFVLMLPNTPLDEAVQVLTRLQRSLSKSLFEHEGKEVFVTFSAGATLYRPGETLEAALDRADVALYEAKHTGKNRTCIAD